MNKNLQKATFGAGCFWGVEEAFRKVPGVVSTQVGYSDGDFKNPTYEDVCSGKTGHAEVVQIEYDEEKILFEELLEIFFKIHDPTTLNKQGPDIGAQYRSVIFYYTQEQEKIAKAKVEKIEKQGTFKTKIVTEIKEAKEFWKAEEYHQRYLQKMGISR